MRVQLPTIPLYFNVSVFIHIPVTRQCKLVLARWWQCCASRQVTVGLVESSGSLPQSCRLCLETGISSATNACIQCGTPLLLPLNLHGIYAVDAQTIVIISNDICESVEVLSNKTMTLFGLIMLAAFQLLYISAFHPDWISLCMSCCQD